VRHSEKYFEKVFEPLGKLIFPVGLDGSEEQEAFGAVDCDVFCAMRPDRKKGKMFWELVCQVLLRQRQIHHRGLGAAFGRNQRVVAHLAGWMIVIFFGATSENDCGHISSTPSRADSGRVVGLRPDFVSRYAAVD
jgi:hypothetical protein